jgi:hypothetical protein
VQYRDAVLPDVGGDPYPDVNADVALVDVRHLAGDGGLGALAPLAVPAEPVDVDDRGEIAREDVAAPLRVVLVPAGQIERERAGDPGRLVAGDRALVRLRLGLTEPVPAAAGGGEGACRSSRLGS